MSINVIKIGGSLARTGAAETVLQRLRLRTHEHWVVVPGGGVFADAVRAEQHVRAFSDLAAHQMALIAMRMTACMWVDLVNGYAIADDLEQMRRCWTNGLLPIWAPEKMILDAPSVRPSWDVTSDSLAAWLARAIAAERLLVLKSCAIAEGWSRDARRLADAGIVDAAFPDFVQDIPAVWAVASVADLEHRW